MLLLCLYILLHIFQHVICCLFHCELMPSSDKLKHRTFRSNLFFPFAGSVSNLDLSRRKWAVITITRVRERTGGKLSISCRRFVFLSCWDFFQHKLDKETRNKFPRCRRESVSVVFQRRKSNIIILIILVIFQHDDDNILFHSEKSWQRRRQLPLKRCF